MEDRSWIRPNKYMGIGWGMHIGKYTFWEGSQHGATTENAKLYIDFASRSYLAEVYADGPDADWEINPTSIQIDRREVRRGSALQLRLAAGGGQALRFRAVGG